MLVLTRKADQRIQIGNNIVITILHVKGNAVSVGIEAPREIRVMRGEIAARAIVADSPTDVHLEPAPVGAASESSRLEVSGGASQGTCGSMSRHSLPADTALGSRVLRRREPNASLLPTLNRLPSRLAPVSQAERLARRH